MADVKTPKEWTFTYHLTEKLLEILLFGECPGKWHWDNNLQYQKCLRFTIIFIIQMFLFRYRWESKNPMLLIEGKNLKSEKYENICTMCVVKKGGGIGIETWWGCYRIVIACLRGAGPSCDVSWGTAGWILNDSCTDTDMVAATTLVPFAWWATVTAHVTFQTGETSTTPLQNLLLCFHRGYGWAPGGGVGLLAITTGWCCWNGSWY